MGIDSVKSKIGLKSITYLYIICISSIHGRFRLILGPNCDHVQKGVRFGLDLF